MKFDPSQSLPQTIDFIDIDFPVGHIHCGNMDFTNSIVKIEGKNYLANNGMGEFGLFGPLILQIQKEIISCPACGENL